MSITNLDFVTAFQLNNTAIIAQSD